MPVLDLPYHFMAMSTALMVLVTAFATFATLKGALLGGRRGVVQWGTMTIILTGVCSYSVYGANAVDDWHEGCRSTCETKCRPHRAETMRDCSCYCDTSLTEPGILNAYPIR